VVWSSVIDRVVPHGLRADLRPRLSLEALGLALYMVQERVHVPAHYLLVLPGGLRVLVCGHAARDSPDEAFLGDLGNEHLCLA